MGSDAEGLQTVEIKKVSELLAQGRANKELWDLGSFERMYYTMYGPFMLNGIKWEMRIYPVGEDLRQYLCLLDDDAVIVKKYGFMNLLPNNLNSRSWFVGASTKITEEKDFKADKLGEGLGLRMVELSIFSRRDEQNFGTDDCFVLKLAIWFILDDSIKPPPRSPKPTFIPHDPNKPNVISPLPSIYPESVHVAEPPAPVTDPDRPKHCSSDLITTLLRGEFADMQCVIDGQIFLAHRAVLAARSSVFRSEFLPLEHEMCQNSVFVSIQLVDALTFKFLLHFIYTDSLAPDFHDDLATPLALERYRRLFIAAHLFKIEGLKKICEEKLTRDVTNSILSTLDVIKLPDCGLLKIVQKDCDMKPELITSTTMQQKVGDRQYSNNIPKEHVGKESK
ncbi:hypothetical protein LUZ61_001469 [Rhynchospora tenuis]|uniref:BTB domain-containing protein n=1 Tax=Rhynchospora tenuis TaxID=198213 RepID=A0AAD6EQU3_9POAL|nr:hypothetical protein LUZ61_001469 [Rhynchospora tenuis]